MSRPLAALAALLLAAGCRSATAPAAGPGEIALEVETPLVLGETRRIAGTDWRVTFTAVPEFSLCPPLAMCIWAGTATARFTLATGAADTVVTFALPAATPPTVQWRGLRLALVDLQAAPDTTVAGRLISPNYRARLLAHRD
ncbi:MAG: hypothetical protein HY275_14275 [Gemmatimonadetes bacterium]|nr:hypothetical protein [Gemmatimonadota bacterium]